MRWALASSLLLGLAWIPTGSYAQADVCCVMSRTSGDDVSTIATTRSSSRCGKGMAAGEYTVCKGFDDRENLCSTLGAKSQCEACGYHWSGKSCLKEDPVKKAKTELQQEEKDKKKGVKKATPREASESGPEDPFQGIPAPESASDQAPASLPPPD